MGSTRSFKDFGGILEGGVEGKSDGWVGCVTGFMVFAAL